MKFLSRTTRQQHMKKKQRRRRTDTFHFQKFTFPLSFNRLRPQKSSVVVHPPPEFPDIRELPNLRSYLLRARYVSTLPGLSRRLLWWCALIGRFLQIGGPRTGSRRDGRTRTAHLSGSYLLCTDRQRDC